MCFKDAGLILKTFKDSKEPCLKNIKTVEDLIEFFKEYDRYWGSPQGFPNTEQGRKIEKISEAMANAFAEYEENTYKALYTEDSSLCVENIKKYFDKAGTNVSIFNGYTDDSFFEDNPGLMDYNSNEVKYSKVDWEKVIKVAETGKYKINLHHNEDYATLFLDFNKDRIEIRNGFLDEGCWDHLCEDLEDAIKRTMTAEKFDKIMDRT